MTSLFPQSFADQDDLSLLFKKRAARAVAPSTPVSPQNLPAPRVAQVSAPALPLIVAATDGSSKGNPGPGGWCWFVDHENWASGSHKNVTNNAMELLAVAALLEATAGSGRPVLIRADSKYVIDACTKWIHGWKKNGWMTGAKKPVSNREVIERIDGLLRTQSVRFEWVKAHNGDILNEAADTRAYAAATQAKAGIEKGYGPGLTV